MKKEATIKAAVATLTDALRALPPTGEAGFEGLVAVMLSRFTGLQFLLAASGRQEGRDLRARTEYGTHVAVECKRYGSKTKLDERELIAELAQASRSLPHLDLWILVTSRPVPDLLEQQLEAEAQSHGVAFAVLDCPAEAMGSLAALCAEHDADVLSRVPGSAKRELEKALAMIRKDRDFTSRLQSVRKTFLQPWVGFEQVRRESHAKLRQWLSDRAESRAAFLQDLAVANAALPRDRFLRQMASWYASNAAQAASLIVLGEEGDGKSWLVANWALGRLDESDCPLILLLPSWAVSSTDPEAILAQALATLSVVTTSERWTQRLRRWMNKENTTVPSILLVLDGVNEKFSPTHWRELFTRLETTAWCQHLRLVVTCRLTYWKSKLQPGFSRPSVSLLISSYDDDELDAALQARSLSRSELPPTIMAMLRKPRYFDLVVRHREQLAQSGDFTVARLLYEDWRDRYERRVNLPLDPDAFNELLKRIAARAQDGERRLRMSELQQELPPIDGGQLQELYTELESSGVIVVAPGGRVEVVSERLTLGLGLLLVDYAIDAHGQGSSVSETVHQLMEPAAGIDEKAKILERASLHALILEDCPEKVRVTLLATWLNLQNRDDPECRNFISYLPQCPSAFFDLAQDLWRTPVENPWGQQLLLEGILHWRSVPDVHALAVRYADIWLSYIPSYDQPIDARGGDAHEESRRVESRAKLEANLAGLDIAETISVGSFLLRPISNPGRLRLGRVALAYIAEQPRAMFAHSLATGVLAESVQAYLTKLDILGWVIRTAPDSEELRQGLFKEVNDLCQIEGMSAAITAAHRLLRAEASPQSVAKKALLPEEPAFEFAQRIAEHQRDPCVSFFSWTRDDCIRCMTRTDVSIQRLASRTKVFWRDPDFPRLQSIVERLQSPEIVGPNQLWQYRQFSPVESFLESVEPAFHACAPNLFAQRIRDLFLNAGHRTGDALWALLIHVDDYSLLLDDRCLGALHEVWESLSTKFAGQDLRQLEWTLFNELLKQWEPEEQLRRILARAPEAFDLESFARNFKPVPPGLCDTISLAEDDASIRRAVWFLSRSPEFVKSRLYERTLDHPDSFIRSMAMAALYRSEDDWGKKNWLERGWIYSPEFSREEAYWGSRLLMDAPDVEPEEALRRIDPALVLDLAEMRQWTPIVTASVSTYLGEWLSAARERVRQGIVLVLPATKIVADPPMRPTDVRPSAVSSVEPDHSMRFISHSVIWGGMYATATRDLFREESASEWQVRIDKVINTVEAARRQGSHWLDRRVDGRSLAHLLSDDPSIETKLLHLIEECTPTSDNFIVESYGLLVALCAHLLNARPEAGVRLYRRLKACHSLTTHEATGAALEWADLALFRSVKSEPVMRLWETTLQQSKSDGDLLMLSILARSGDARNWIEEKISTDLRESNQFARARATVLAGLLDLPVPPAQADTWLSDVVEVAMRYRDLDRWGQVWLTRFVCAGDDVTAFSAFKLLLECADRRLWIWWEELVARLDTPLSARRDAFLRQSIGSIKKAIEKNEKSMFDSFLTVKVAEGQVWPWLHLIQEQHVEG
ncbi:hypothetical protein [Cupriavidus basilensis]|uniref:hypothetical protein n=1 Tax=Cupriavidus basilensis TaxID=68895 RepID=UPI00157A8EC8|nr:hypothetical protein [Cupriavidus basilensis]NUA25969.1 hypothetical protein [Cupriavidus basilensis]